MANNPTIHIGRDGIIHHEHARRKANAAKDTVTFTAAAGASAGSWNIHFQKDRTPFETHKVSVPVGGTTTAHIANGVPGMYKYAVIDNSTGAITDDSDIILE
jgi:hypothetical protein